MTTEELTEPRTCSPSRRLAERYGAEQDWTPTEWNETLDVLLSHRSVRKWQDRDVDKATLRMILAAAQPGASSSNQQIVSVVVARRAETKAKLAEVAGERQAAHITSAPVVLVWLIDYARALSLANTHGYDVGGLDYLDAALVGATDIGIAAQNAVVAAESLGLGTVFLGSLRSDAEKVTQILDLPPGVVPFVGLEIGHPDPSELAGVKPRLPQNAIVHEESYDHSAAAREIGEYDDTLARYYQQFGQKHQWSTQLLRRLGADALTSSNRWKLRTVFDKAGLRLR